MPLSQMVAPYSPTQTPSGIEAVGGPRRHLPYFIRDTNAIESLNARFRRAVRHRGHFPNEQAAMNVLYLVATSRRQNPENMTGRTHNWKQILNALTIHYGDRLTITQ
jgi:transposase-like protein